MNVAIRTDSSTLIGSGHVMRCLTLADMLKKKFHNVFFICRDLSGNSIEIIENRGFAVKKLPFPDDQKKKYTNIPVTDNYKLWLGVSKDIDCEETIDILKSETIDLIVVDSYSIDIYWEKKVRAYVSKIMVIDDLANRKHDCDILLDHNFYIDYENRYDDLVPSKCMKLLGTRHALINPKLEKVKNYRENKKNKTNKIENILVFLGGNDPRNYTEKAIKKILNFEEFKKITINVVLGKNNLKKLELKTKYAEYDNIVFHVQPNYYFDLLKKSDLAFGAGGVSQIERMYIQLPSVILSLADNQRKITKDAITSAFAISFEKLNKLILVKNFKVKLLKANILDIDFLKIDSFKYKISIVSDRGSWINEYIPNFIKELNLLNYRVEWLHNHKDIYFHDIVVLLSYSKITSKHFLDKNKYNLVVHESDLPRGKGWSPLTWQILEGHNTIPITLFEADEKIDNGKIYLQEYLRFNGTELVNELRLKQAEYTFKLLIKFINNRKEAVKNSRRQTGRETYYTKRTPLDSELDLDKTISDQFNLLRVVDNEKYPAFFMYKNNKYILKIYKN